MPDRDDGTDWLILLLLVVRRFLAAAAVIGVFCGCDAPDAPAQCSNGWCKAGCDDNGICNNLKVTSRNYPHVVYMNNHPTGYRDEEADCEQFRWRVWEKIGSAIEYGRFWKVMPGSAEEAKIKTVCNEKFWPKSVK